MKNSYGHKCDSEGYKNPFTSTKTILSTYAKKDVNCNNDVSSRIKRLRNIYKCAGEIILLRQEYGQSERFSQENTRIDEAISGYLKNLDKYEKEKRVDEEIAFVKEVIEWI